MQYTGRMVKAFMAKFGQHDVSTDIEIGFFLCIIRTVIGKAQGLNRVCSSNA